MAIDDAVADAPSQVAAQDHLIAIDVLLQPDSEMLEQSAKWNERMREQFPQGFALDAEHSPHVTLLQRYISESDLGAVLAAVEGVRSRIAVDEVEMEATGIYHIPAGVIGLAGIVVKPSPDLLALQQSVIEAVNPFAKTGGDQSAFVPDTTGTPFNPILFNYVDTFVPNQTGSKFNPHVSIGVAPLSYLEALEKQPFKSFTFRGEGIAVYHLGNFGTAAKRLDGGK